MCMVSTTIAFIPIVLIITFAETIFSLLGQNEEASALAGSYLRVALPGIFFQILFMNSQVFLTAVNRNDVPLIILISMIPLHLFNTWIFVIKMDKGVIGSAIAFDITYFVGYLSIHMYLFVFTKDEDINSCFKNVSSIHDYFLLVELALTNILWSFTDYYAFFSIVIISGAIGVKE